MYDDDGSAVRNEEERAREREVLKIIIFQCYLIFLFLSQARAFSVQASPTGSPHGHHGLPFFAHTSSHTTTSTAHTSAPTHPPTPPPVTSSTHTPSTSTHPSQPHTTPHMSSTQRGSGSNNSNNTTTQPQTPHMSSTQRGSGSSNSNNNNTPHTPHMSSTQRGSGSNNSNNSSNHNTSGGQSSNNSASQSGSFPCPQISVSSMNMLPTSNSFTGPLTAWRLSPAKVCLWNIYVCMCCVRVCVFAKL